MSTTNSKVFAFLNNLLASLPSIAKTYHIPANDFKKLFATVTEEKLQDVMAQMPQGRYSYELVKFRSNVGCIEVIKCFDKQNNTAEILNSPAVETRITFGNGKKTIYYFDSLYVDNRGMLIGICSRIMPSLTQGIPLNEVASVDVQKGSKAFSYYSEGTKPMSQSDRLKPYFGLTEKICVGAIFVAIILGLLGQYSSIILLTFVAFILGASYANMAVATPDDDLNPDEVKITKAAFWGCCAVVVGVYTSTYNNAPIRLPALVLGAVLLTASAGYFIYNWRAPYVSKNKVMFARILVLLTVSVILIAIPQEQITKMLLPITSQYTGPK